MMDAITNSATPLTRAERALREADAALSVRDYAKAREALLSTMQHARDCMRQVMREQEEAEAIRIRQIEYDQAKEMSP